MNRSVRILAVAVMLQSGLAWSAATLEIRGTKVESGRVILPVLLGGDVGPGVSAMDFRLTYNPNLLRPLVAEAGEAAVRADKRVMANLQTPGEYVVVMMGFNQSVCQSGEMVRIVMEPAADSLAGDWQVGIIGQTLSSLEGTVIESQALPFQQPAIPPDEGPDASRRRRPGQGAVPEPERDTPTATESAEDKPPSPPAAFVAPPPIPVESGARDAFHAAAAEADRARSGIETPGAPSAAVPPEPRTDLAQADFEAPPAPERTPAPESGEAGQAPEPQAPPRVQAAAPVPHAPPADMTTGHNNDDTKTVSRPVLIAVLAAAVAAAAGAGLITAFRRFF